MLKAFYLTMLFAWCAAGGAEVTAGLSAETVEVGKAVRLAIEVDGGSADGGVEIPEVPDLVVSPRGQSRQMSLINGRMSRSTTYNYVVGSQKPGEYRIPSFAIRVDGERFEIQSLKLRVTPSASAAPAGMDAGQAIPADPKRYGYLTFQMVKKDREHVYPGEIAPVRIRAFFPIRARVSLNGPPRPEGSAFTLHNLSEQPEQEQTVVDGRRYLMVTWYGGLSATKVGRYPASFTLEGTVAVRERSAGGRPSAMDDPFFGRSLLDDMFAPMVQKDVELTTPDPPELEVRELPVAGRPDDFSGAIGRFDFGRVDLPSTMHTGDPVRVEAAIEGEGNFALLRQPQPRPAGEWKTYDGTEEFTPGDMASFGGIKRFEFSAVPKMPGQTSVTLGFSYFDPEKGEYRQVESLPQEVEILGQPLADEGDQGDGAAVAPTVPTQPELAPIRRERGGVRAYRPLTAAPWFVPVLTGCGGLAAGLLGFGAWQGRREKPQWRARRERLLVEARALLAADQAVRKGDAPRFLEAARGALKERFAGVSGIRPEAVTLADLDGQVEAEVLELWRLADRLDYSGEADGVGDLGAWREVLDRGMKALEAGS